MNYSLGLLLGVQRTELHLMFNITILFIMTTSLVIVIISIIIIICKVMMKCNTANLRNAPHK